MAAMVRDLLRSPLAERYDLVAITTYRHAAGRVGRVAVFAGGLARLLAFCLGRGPRLVHVHTAVRGSWYRKAICVVVARAARRPVVLQLHVGPVDIAAFWDRLGSVRQRLLRWSFGRADRVVSVSRAGAAELERRLRLSDVLVIPNAAPRPAPPAHVPEVRSGAEGAPAAPGGARNGAVRVLFAGGFRDPAKGGAVLLAALDREDAGPPLRVDLAGPGDPPADVERLAAAGRVRWLGYLGEDAKAQALASADIVTLPSLSEGLPVWLLEAMIAGRPVVATRTGGVPDVVTDGVDGVLVAPGDAGALMDALRALAADPDRRARLGDAARERVARLNEEEVHGPLDRLYRELLGR